MLSPEAMVLAMLRGQKESVMPIRGLLLGAAVLVALVGPALAAGETEQETPQCRTAEVNPVTGHVLCIEQRLEGLVHVDAGGDQLVRADEPVGRHHADGAVG